MSETIQRTVVVTGGSRGIGRAVCRVFGVPGCRVFFNYAAAAAAAGEVEQMVAAAGGRATGIQADVTDETSVKAFIDRVLTETGRIDVLVNNAGITRDGLLVRMKADDWDAVVDTNLKGAFLCTKMAAKVMMKQRYGRIINISSVVAVTGNPGQANYVASKAGLIGFTKAVALELASRGITVNAVAPGFIETDMTASLGEKARDAMVGQIPLGRAGTPDEVAAVVEFLASAKAAYLTGQVLHVSGGLYV
ncbi:MAG: 3-oxoacyl-[acyl-carrier-protein] reductase [Desulfobacterales bacterium]|jgi:3-oxoacyl-[acyl-carrier protein] reductase